MKKFWNDYWRLQLDSIKFLRKYRIVWTIYVIVIIIVSLPGTWDWVYNAYDSLKDKICFWKRRNN